MDSPEEISFDRLKGSMLGHHIGDALGGPHEFYRWNRDRIYTGKLYLTLYRKNTMYGKNIEHIHPIGMVTDDTQMTCALINCIIANKGYNRQSAIEEYLTWAHSGNTGMGKNTQYLFKNKTYKGYLSRFKKLMEEIESGEKEEPLSNGCLMRCAPLAIFSNEKYIEKDVSITNPFDICIESCIIYCRVLRNLLLGGTIKDSRSIIKRFYKKEATDEDLIDCLKEVTKGKTRNIDGKDKGYILHALWCAFTALLMDLNYEDTMYWVITQHLPDGKERHGVGDTDTNAAIAGALIGARDGWNELSESERTVKNWKHIEKTINKVDGELANFLPLDVDKTVKKLLKITK